MGVTFENYVHIIYKICFLNVALAGKGAGELNLIILIPKTEARAQGGEVS